MKIKTKKLFSIGFILFLGFFSWDFSVNTAFLQNFDRRDCPDIPVSECEQTSGCKIQTDRSEKKTCVNKGFLGIGASENDRKEANQIHCNTYEENGDEWKKIFYDSDNNKITQETHGKTTYEGAKSRIKTACKNDAQCRWSFGNCLGKSRASTEEYLVCKQAGLEKCGITLGCDISPDGTQCLPSIDEEFDENSDEYSEFGTYKGPVFGGPGLRAGARIAKQKLDNTISKERSLKNLLIYWTNFALSITSVIAVIALIYAGFLYITDMGDGSNSEKAKKIILYVAIGIVVILGSYAIVNTVMKARFGNDESAISYNHTIPTNSYFRS